MDGHIEANQTVNLCAAPCAPLVTQHTDDAETRAHSPLRIGSADGEYQMPNIEVRSLDYLRGLVLARYAFGFNTKNGQIRTRIATHQLSSYRASIIKRDGYLFISLDGVTRRYNDAGSPNHAARPHSRASVNRHDTWSNSFYGCRKTLRRRKQRIGRLRLRSFHHVPP
jgi:hypothetical protein